MSEYKPASKSINMDMPQKSKSRLQRLLEQLSKLIIDNPQKIFTCFPDLPIEIRLKIWKHASEIPRTIELCITRESESDLAINGNHKSPVVLHVSTESREEAMKHYTLCRQRRLPNRDPAEFQLHRRGQMYVNFNSDCFRITNDSFFSPPSIFEELTSTRPSYPYTYSPRILGWICFMELEVNTMERKERYKKQMPILWREFELGGYLKEFTLVHNFPYWRDKGHIKFESADGHLLMHQTEEMELKEMRALVHYFTSRWLREGIMGLRLGVRWDILIEVEFDPAFLVDGTFVVH
jgi:hypothetical protein